MADLGEKHGRRQLGERITKAKEESTTHEDAQGATATLHDGAYNHDDASDDNREFSAEAVGEEWDNGNGCHATNLVKSTKQTEH